MHCPSNNSFLYNTIMCACNPGYFYNATGDTCSPFTVSGADDFLVGSGVDYSFNIPVNIFSFDSIKKLTHSQAVFLEATLVLMASWLVFCFVVRFGSLGDGRTPWFQIRWWISRLDVLFARNHWLDDQMVVKKRKTELGGAFSIASWILFLGLFAALLYQIISKRTVEIHSVVATNAPDLASFKNNMEFNITTISSMTCSNLRGPDTLITGNPGLTNFKTTPLSIFGNFSCQNTTNGPTITIKCDKCQLIRDNLYISWHFIDLPNMPASAVGFEFKLTARDPRHEKHLSFISGALKNGSMINAKFVTYRGKDPNILQFNLFPRIYRNKHDLKLIQPLFHEFVPGSSFGETGPLRDSLERYKDGLVNVTLYMNFLSSYIVEIDNRNILGPVGVLADLGGLYCVSIGFFFYFLVQFEYRFKNLRHEDNVMISIRNRRKAREQWDKIRKYVTFTWGHGRLSCEDGTFVESACCIGLTVPTGGSSCNRSQEIKADNDSFNTKVNKVLRREGSGDVNSEKEMNKSSIMRLNNEDTRGCATDIPLPPSLEMRHGSESSVGEIEKNLGNLYQYNTMIREKLVMTQSMLHALTSKVSPSSSKHR